MVNAQKHRELLADTETRIRKQMQRKYMLSNNSKKDFESLNRKFGTHEQKQDNVINRIVDNKIRNKEEVIQWI